MSDRRLVVGVMGAGHGASPNDVELAEALGEAIAREGWILLTGGRNAGVMAAAGRGAKRVAGSLILGILPGRGDGSDDVAPTVDVAVFTGMNDGRNIINVLTSDVVVACGAGGAGTASEVALAMKSARPVVLVAPSAEGGEFFRTLGVGHVARSAEEAIKMVRAIAGR